MRFISDTWKNPSLTSAGEIKTLSSCPMAMSLNLLKISTDLPIINDWEGSVFNSDGLKLKDNDPVDSCIQYPKTRLIYHNGIPVLFMEFVEHLNTEGIIERFGNEPRWVWRVDGGQVGANKDGRLVAYDYGPR